MIQFHFLILHNFQVSAKGTPEADCHPIPADQFQRFMDEVFYGEWLITRALKHKHFVKFGKSPDVTLPDLEKCRKELPQVGSLEHLI